jgi:3-oxoacyl-[acyl-carrier-protein] synthase II
VTPQPVALASAGCLSAIGIGFVPTARNLRAGVSGVGPVTLFEASGCRCSTAAEVDSVELRRAASTIHAPAARWSRAAQMVLVATAEALAGSPGFVPDIVIIGTTSGAMDLGEGYFRAVGSGKGIDSAARQVRRYPPQVPVIQTLEALGCPAPIRVVSNACASGTNALGMAWQLVRSGRARRVLAGGYDALSRLVFAGFDCLQASTPELCRPFDKDRTGLVLGEGAAMFCISSEGPIRFSGYGSTTDTHHLTQPHPSGEGPRSAMQAACDAAGSHPTHIDYVNAHGTATPQNDACEALAIGSVCPAAPVSSTKAATGHTLGAAGAIEAAFCMVALEQGFLPPTLNFRSPDPTHSLDIVANVARVAAPRTVLSNSFGFGGANASIILELP